MILLDGDGRHGWNRTGTVGSSRCMTASGCCGRRLLTLKGQIDPRSQLLEAEGFHNVVHGTTAKPSEHISFVTLCGHHDHGHGAQNIVAFQPTKYLEATQPGHHRVEQYQLWGLPGGQ